MGFDLYGRNKNSKVGEYFRNNVWWWRPLAEYVLDVCSDVMDSDESEHWGSNSGKEVSGETATAIADRLDLLIKSGATKRFEQKYMEEIKATPDVICTLCNGTGDRKDLEPPSWKKKCGGCNGCSGTGKVRPFSAQYPFSADNVQSFSKFCRASDGFSIC